MGTYHSPEYSKFGSTGWSAYRAELELSKSSTAGNAKTTIKWTVKVQMKYAWGYGVGIKLTGADSGSASGHLTYNPGSSWATVASKSGSVTIEGTTSTQTKKFTATAYGTTHSGYGSAGGSVSVTESVSVPALKSYTIKYNANGGSGAPSTQTKYYGKKKTLSSTRPTRTGYTFEGWNTKKDGKGTNYSSGGTYSANADVTLYAKWAPITYTVTYNNNGGAGGPNSQTKYYNVDLTLSTSKPTKNGHQFMGWSTDGKTVSYKSGSVYKLNHSVTLIAVWKTNTYTVNYSSNGRSGSINPSTQTIGQSISLSKGVGIVPGQDEYLESWNTKSDGTGTRYTLGSKYTSTVVAEITLYAQYKDIIQEYTLPAVNIGIKRIDSSDKESTGGKRFVVNYEWFKGRQGSTIHNGVFTLEVNVGGTWTTLLTESSGDSNGGSTDPVSEHPEGSIQAFRATMTDTTTPTYEDDDGNVVSTTQQVEIEPPGRIIPTTIEINGFQASRESNVSDTVNFSIDWDAYYDGNDIYIGGTYFKVAALEYRYVGEQKVYEDTPVEVITEIITGAEGITFGTIDIPVNYNADFYITDFYSKLTPSQAVPEHYTIDVIGTSTERDGVSAGGFPVHISHTGEGISLFGIAADTLIGLEVNEPTILKKALKVEGETSLQSAVNMPDTATINNATITTAKINSLNVSGDTALNGTLSVGGTVIAGGSIIIPNNASLYGKNNLNENRDLVRIGSNNNLFVGSTTQREDFKKNGTTGGQTVIYGRGIYFYTGTSSSTNAGTTYIDTDGYIHVKGHSTPIGASYNESFSDDDLNSGTSSYSWKSFSLGLGAGVWVVTIYGSFSANSTGQRWITIGYGPQISNVTQLVGSTQSTNALGNSLATGLLTTGILVLSSTQNVYIGMRQNSGSKLTVSARCRAVRIR